MGAVRVWPAVVFAVVWTAAMAVLDAVFVGWLAGAPEPDGLRSAPFLGMLLATFNSLTVLFWRDVRRKRRAARPDDVTGGLETITRDGVTRVVPNGLGPTGAAAFAGFGVIGLAALLGPLAIRLDLPAAYVVGTLVVAALVAALAHRWIAARRRTGAGELVIDAGARTIRLPRAYRTAPSAEATPWSRIERLEVAVQSMHVHGAAIPMYFVQAILSDGTRARVESALWPEKVLAERFCRWLSERIGLGQVRTSGRT